MSPLSIYLILLAGMLIMLLFSVNTRTEHLAWEAMATIAKHRNKAALHAERKKIQKKKTE